MATNFLYATHAAKLNMSAKSKLSLSLNESALTASFSFLKCKLNLRTKPRQFSWNFLKLWSVVGLPHRCSNKSAAYHKTTFLNNNSKIEKLKHFAGQTKRRSDKTLANKKNYIFELTVKSARSCPFVVITWFGIIQFVFALLWFFFVWNMCCCMMHHKQ